MTESDSQEERTPLLKTSLRLSYGSPSMGRRPQHKKHISSKLRWMTNGSALACVFLFSGIIFGWSPLKLLLQREGQYHKFCINETDGIPCVAQMARYNKVFTWAQFFLSFSSLPVGFILDHAPKTVHYGMAAFLEICGLVLFGLADSSSEASTSATSWDSFVVAYTLLALGGSMSMMGAFPASFLLPKYQGGILAAISCLFDASSIVFAVFGQVNAASPTIFSRRHLFLGYAVLCAGVFGILTMCWAVLEARDWKKALGTQEQLAEIAIPVSHLVDDDDDDDDDDAVVLNDETASDLHGKRIQAMGLHEWTVVEQLMTFDFWLVLVFASVHMLRCNFYIETVNEVLQQFGDDDAAYANIFGFVLPTGVIFVPLIDAMVRNVGVVQTLHITNVLGVVFGVLLLVPSLYVQCINFFIFTCFRAFLYATLNTFIAVTFGVSTMGRVIGCAFTTAAIVTLLQYPAASLAEDVHGGDFFVTNCLLLGAAVVPIVMALYYSWVVCAISKDSDEV